MMDNGTIFSVVFCVISAITSIVIVFNWFRKDLTSKKITLTKKDGRELTVSTKYNRSDSKRMLEFIHE